MNEQFEVWMYFGEASDRVVAALGASKSYPERLSWSLLVVLLIHLNEYKLQHLPRNDAFAEKRRICRETAHLPCFLRCACVFSKQNMDNLV